MGEYLVPLRSAEGNLVFTRDGHVWANFLIAAPNVSPYHGRTVGQAQKANKALFDALSRLRTSDILLLGVKVKTPAEEIINRVISGIPHISVETHPSLVAELDAFYSDVKRDVREEFRREYVLSIEIPTSVGATGRAFAKAGAVDPFADVDMNAIRRVEAEFFSAIPDTFAPVRMNPDHLRWLHERLRRRGLSVPSLPPPAQSATFSVGGFANVMTVKNADTEAVFDEFVERVETSPNEKVRKTKIARFRRNFRSTRLGQALAVFSPDERTDALPDGPASVQSLVVVQSYPTRKKHVLNSFTYLVDQEIGLDADFACRIQFSQAAISVETAREFRVTLDSEELANASDNFDELDYQDRWKESAALQMSKRSEPDPRGMRMATIFALAHPNKTVLRKRREAFVQHLNEHGFTVTAPVGGQYDLLLQMLPGSSASELVEHVRQGATTTVRQFAACVPVRVTTAGDRTGWPIAINKENALGQFIHMNVLGSTDAGNGSVATVGAQGAGKSMFLKVMQGFLSDVHSPTWVIDQSANGEYAVYSRSLGRTQLLDVKAPTASLDVLKTMPPDLAKQWFLDLYLPLLGLRQDDEEFLELSALLDPKVRATNNINSSVDIIEHLERRGGTPASQSLKRKLQFWAGQSYTRVLFDGRGEDGHPKVLPAFDPRRNNIVFRTNGLTVPTGKVDKHTPPSQIFAQTVYTAIAALAAYEFSRRRELCALIGDEMSFLEGSTVLRALVKAPDRTGRKEKNIVLVGSQRAAELGDGNYSMIKKKLVLKQETRDNAIEAFTWADIPATEKMIDRMLTDTSPVDPRTKKVVAGREGEGWFNDGDGQVVRVQTLAMFTPGRRRDADTTSSTMDRWDDLTEDERAGVSSV